ANQPRVRGDQVICQVCVSLGVHHKPEPLVLEANELADGGGNEQAAWNQMCLQLRHDLLRRLLICILLTGGDLTGLPMDGLVSYQEQNTAALQTLDANIRVVRVGPIAWWLIHGWVLAGEPRIVRRRLTGA